MQSKYSKPPFYTGIIIILMQRIQEIPFTIAIKIKYSETHSIKEVRDL